MKFTKSIKTITFIAILALMSAPALACEPNDTNCAPASLEISSIAVGGGISGDIETVRVPRHQLTGAALGGGIAGGIAAGEIEGHGCNVDLDGSIDTVAGGLSKTDTWEEVDHLGNGGVRFVGTATETYAISSTEMEIEVDPATKRIRHRERPTGHGSMYGSFFGVVGQGSVSASGMILPNRLYDTDGFTGGFAAQGSLGCYSGFVYARDGKAKAGAEIEMSGFTYSESYRGKTYEDGWSTEFMGTNVGAETSVTTNGFDRDKGRAYADVDGHYVAGGVAGAATVQMGDNGFGAAKAVGTYSGSGDLNTNYEGSAYGGTYSSYSTLDGYSGAIVSTGANMSVSSISSRTGRR